jgi:hypothetical protein
MRSRTEVCPPPAGRRVPVERGVVLADLSRKESVPTGRGGRPRTLRARSRTACVRFSFEHSRLPSRGSRNSGPGEHLIPITGKSERRTEPIERGCSLRPRNCLQPRALEDAHRRCPFRPPSRNHQGQGPALHESSCDSTVHDRSGGNDSGKGEDLACARPSAPSPQRAQVRPLAGGQARVISDRLCAAVGLAFGRQGAGSRLNARCRARRTVGSRSVEASRRRASRPRLRPP